MNTEPKKTKVQEIEELLKALGHEPMWDGDGNCARAAIYNGHIKLTGQPSDLDQVIISGTLDCGHFCKATLGDLLDQPDLAGGDFLDMANISVYCDKYSDDTGELDCFPGGSYVTGICSGNPTFDSGQFHNHCNRCEGFGRCVGDMREGHCNRCGKHYSVGYSGDVKCECGGTGR